MSTFNPTADTYLASLGSADTNFDTAGLSIGKAYVKSGGPQKLRMLMKFDISSETGLTPNGASLQAYCYFDTTTLTDTIATYRCKRAWVENQVTWNVYSTGNAWETAGGSGANDVDYTIGPGNGAFATAIDTWATIASGAGFLAIVQDAIDNRAGILNIWCYAAAEASPNENNANRYRDSEYGSVLPVLTLTYPTAGRRVFIC